MPGLGDNPKKICRNCLYLATEGLSKRVMARYGECRKDSPEPGKFQLGDVSESMKYYLRAVWPFTRENKWCGRWRSKEKGS